MKAKKQFCVCASTLIDSVGRTFAAGDGITSALNRIYAITDTLAEAESAKAQLMRSATFQRPRMPGDGRMVPELEVCPFDPLDFVGRQNRDDYTGKRYAALCGQLAADAKKNAASL